LLSLSDSYPLKCHTRVKGIPNVAKSPMTNYAKQPNTGYYGSEGGIMPVFSCGAQALSPSLLTGDGSHMSFWTAVVIHVAALALNLAANITFFTASRSGESNDLHWTWAIFSLVAHTLAVLGTLTYTGFVRSALGMPNVLVLVIGLFFGAIVATGKISYAQSEDADAAENVLYNLSIVFQIFGMSSVLVNAIVVSSKSGGL